MAAALSQRCGDWLPDALETYPALAQQCAEIAHWQRLYQQCTPTFLHASTRVISWDETHRCMSIGVDNAALATRLRQQLPTLVQKMAARDGRVQAIRLVLQAAIARHPTAAPAAPARSIPAEGLAHWQALAARLPANAPLQQAILRLIAHHQPSSSQ